ncbi:hypothetical protein PG995_014810 [Apiospora arundinis]
MPSCQYSSRPQQELSGKPGLLLVAAAPPRAALTTSNDNSGSQKRAYHYDWAANIKAAKDRLRDANVTELPMSEVGRVVEGGRVKKIYNVDKSSAAQYFIAYDDSEVYARVPQLFMKDTLIYQLAALHVGALNNCSHPDDLELEMDWQRMKDGWAIHVHPKAGTGAKKARS